MLTNILFKFVFFLIFTMLYFIDDIFNFKYIVCLKDVLKEN